MSSTVSYARAEWLVALRRRRTLLLNLLIPAGLVAGLIWGGAPVVHASVVVTVLFAFFGTFGSSVPLVHDLETGRFARLLHAGGSPGSLLAQRVLVSAALDFLQLLPATALILLTYNRSAAPVLLAVLLATLIICNVLGIWIGALTRSIGEAALLSSVGALLLLHFSGVFRTPVPETWSATVAAISPFRGLYQALRSAFGVGAPVSPQTIGALVLIAGAAFTSLFIALRSARAFSGAARR